MISHDSSSSSAPQNLRPPTSELGCHQSMAIAAEKIDGNEIWANDSYQKDGNENWGAEPIASKRKCFVFPFLLSLESFCLYLAMISLLMDSSSMARAQEVVESTLTPSISPIETPVVETPATGQTIAPSSVGINPPGTAEPAIDPTISPTTIAPSMGSSEPTVSPSKSPLPTVSPTTAPSFNPTNSRVPTNQPSAAPTEQPSWTEPSFKETTFRQLFIVGNGREFNEEEQSFLEIIYRGYTTQFSPLPDAEVNQKITSMCQVNRQIIELSERKLNEADNVTEFDTVDEKYLRRRVEEDLQDPNEVNTTLNVDFTMSYESSWYNITDYPRLFQNYTNMNLDTVLKQLQTLGMNVTEVRKAQRILVATPAPTISFAPSSPPTQAPSRSLSPTLVSSKSPFEMPSDAQNGTVIERKSIVIISVASIVAVAIVLTGVFLYYKKKRELEKRGNQSKIQRSSIGSKMYGIPDDAGWNNGDNGIKYSTGTTKAYGSSFGKQSLMTSGLADVGKAVSPNGSLRSNHSLISRGNSIGGDSKEEADATIIFVDEFDQYKDQNLEKMRAGIEGNLEGCDGMMNQAVARALIDDYETSIRSDFYWGGGGDEDMSPLEIEASAVAFIMDWLKRNRNASDREKREILQDPLNKMTASVRHGLLDPNDGSRTIHECAELLGLQLAVEIPVSTIIISGLRKTVSEQDIRKAFKVFGEIVDAAISPSYRGYGILRFNSDRAFDRAMQKFQTEEIVVEDVAVQLLLLRPGSTGEGSQANGGT